ncbi:MAG: polysaccharide deacetylase family protein [Bacteroidia bacterium]|nr:MAG: polysaccharide deacetylase family protein [Bacteroidia bacterium]
MFGTATWQIHTDEKKIYLTFDDSPIPQITEKILEILDIFGAKATFFCVGDNVRKYPEIYRDILQAGHATGNHTYSHLNGYKTDYKHYIEDVFRASEYIDSSLFRPPYGKLRPEQQREILRYFDIVMWNVLSFDFDKTLSEADCFENVKSFTEKGSIIVFHDNIKAESNMLYSLTQTLQLYTHLGYSFERLDAKKVQQNRIVKKKSPLYSVFF